MDKRFFLALFLSLIAIAISQLLFPTVTPTASRRATDSTSGGETSASSTQSTSVQLPLGQAPETVVSQTQATVGAAGGAVRSDEMTTVSTPKANYKYSNIGAAPIP